MNPVNDEIVPLWTGKEMLERIVASLKASYSQDGNLISSEGGDIEVMRQVDRICKNAYWDGVVASREGDV